MVSERLLLLGTAGTGKTYQLSKKLVDYLVDENRSGNIVGMTKTNAAKNVFRDRVVEIGNVVGSFDDVVDFAHRNIKTVASFSLDVVNFPREEIRNRIIDVIIEENILGGNHDKIFEIVENFGLRRKYINPFALSVKTYPGAFNLKGDEKYFYAIKNLLVFNDWGDYKNISSNDIEKFEKSVRDYYKVYYDDYLDLNKFEYVFDKFVNYLEKNNFETFETILIDAVNNLKNSGNIFDYVFVDEANELSYLDLKFIMYASKNVYFAMDPFQTIYNILPLTKKTYNDIISFVGDDNVKYLKTQKRCMSRVFEFARKFFLDNVNKGFIEKGLGRFGVLVFEYLKKVESENKGGFVCVMKVGRQQLDLEITNLLKSKERYVLKTISILTRRKIYEYKIRKNIKYPCSRYGVYVDAILNVLGRMKYESFMLDSIKHLIRPKFYKQLKIRGITTIDEEFVKKYGLEKFIRDAFEINKRDYELLIDVLKRNMNKKIIEIKTIHEAKGSEYDFVILVKDISSSFYNKIKVVCPLVFLQEIFVIFCGITRAVEELFFIEL